MSYGVTLAIVLIAHLVADFYLQSGAMARDKHVDANALTRHCVIYAAVMAPACAFVTSGDGLVRALLLTAGTHAVIDAAKVRVTRSGRGRGSGRFVLMVFCADQLLHLLFCALAAGVCHGETALLPFVSDAVVADAEGMRRALSWVLAVAIALRPASVLVDRMLGAVRNGSSRVGESEGAEDPHVGRYIGCLERTIIVFLMFNGLGQSIALVLTAKSIARFPQFKDVSFAEYYLVGTLTSILVAMVAPLAAQAVVAW